MMASSSHGLFPRRICVVGSLNADFVVRVDRFPRPGETLLGSEFAQFPGGKGANQAYAAARLAAPGTVSMLGQVGDDAHGAWLIDSLARGGVDVAGVGVDGRTSSGIAFIYIDGQGQNQIVLIPGANGTCLPPLEHGEPLASAALLLLQLEIPLPTVVETARLARQGGSIVILDPAPARQLPDSLLALVDYLTPNETELALLDGQATTGQGRPAVIQAARRLLDRGVKNVIVKMGEQGALLVNDAQELWWPALPVVPVDTTAAGDAFNAAFAVALAEGQPVDQAGRWAVIAAGLSVTRAGAQPSMPSRAEVEARLPSLPRQSSTSTSISGL